MTRARGKERVEEPVEALVALDIDPNASLGALVRDAYLGFRRALHDQFQPRKVTSAQWVFLRILWRQDGVTQKELSDQVGNHPSTTVDALRVLERNGYVRRIKDPQDGRAMRVHLTDKGWALRAALMPHAARANEAAMAGITQEEFDTLRRVLLKVRGNLDRFNDAG
jgi:DNA-binding MarR family transcriptional regulator